MTPASCTCGVPSSSRALCQAQKKSGVLWGSAALVMLPACSRGRLSHLSKVKLVYRDPTESWDEYTLLKKGNIHKQSILNVICNPERSLNVRQPPHCLQAETLLSNASATKGMFLCRWLYQLLPL